MREKLNQCRFIYFFCATRKSVEFCNATQIGLQKWHSLVFIRTGSCRLFSVCVCLALILIRNNSNRLDVNAHNLLSLLFKKIIAHSKKKYNRKIESVSVFNWIYSVDVFFSLTHRSMLCQSQLKVLTPDANFIYSNRNNFS